LDLGGTVHSSTALLGVQEILQGTDREVTKSYNRAISGIIDLRSQQTSH